MKLQIFNQFYAKILSFKTKNPKSLDVILASMLTTLLFALSIIKGYVLFEAIMLSIAQGLIFLWILSSRWQIE